MSLSKRVVMIFLVFQCLLVWVSAHSDSHDDTNSTHNDTSSHSSAHDDHEGIIYVVFTTFLALLLGAGTKYVLKNSTIPYTVVLLFLGFLIGELGSLNTDIGEYNRVIMDFDPHLMLYLFLPVLIFESAFSLDYHIFFKQIYSILIMAMPGVLLASIMIAGFIQLLPLYDFTFTESLLVGCILSATDPIAVVALLRSLSLSLSLSHTHTYIYIYIYTHTLSLYVRSEL